MEAANGLCLRCVLKRLVGNEWKFGRMHLKADSARLIRVLVVEDSEDDAYLLLHELRRAGYDPRFKRVASAEDMDAALQLEQWDVVIADQNLPGFTGADALDLLKKRQLDLPFILVSGILSEEAAVTAMRAGAHDFISKNRLARLVPAMERELDDAEVRRQKRKGADALRESEDRYRRLVEACPDAILIVRGDQIVFINSAGIGLFGATSAEQLIGKSPFAFFDTRSYTALSYHIDQALQSGKLAPVMEHTIRRLDYTFADVEASAVPFLDNGSLAIQFVLRDISERKNAEQQLQASEERFRTLFESAPLAMAIHTADGKYLHVNQAYEKMLGYSAEELRVLGAKRVTDPRDVADGQKLFEEMRRGERQFYRREKRYLNKMGQTVWAESTASAVRGRQGELRYIISMVDDITERRQLAEEILTVSEREQERLGQDLHDGLCQTLIGLKFKTTRLASRLPAEAAAEANAIVRLLDQSVNEARSLAQGLHPLSLEAEGLMYALRQLAKNTQSLFGITCRFRCRTPVRLRNYDIAIHLYRIAQEAVSNAIKHAGGSRIVICLAAQNGAIAVTVADSGAGLCIGTEQNGGMGLHIMKYRAQMIGASLEIGRRLRRGTRVHCVVPSGIERLPSVRVEGQASASIPHGEALACAAATAS